MLDLDYIRYLVRNHNDELGLQALARIAKSQGVAPREVLNAVRMVRQELANQ